MAANDPGQPLHPSTELTDWSRNLPTPASALAIGAHPDDVEFGCGGLLAKWAADGCTVHHLVCTDGSKGTWDADVDVDELAARRQDEQREAARRLAGANAGEVRFLGYVDGELDSGLDARGRVALTIRELRPSVVLGHDPWKRYRLHPDHRHAGLLVCEGIVAARDPHFFREHPVEHHRPDALLLWEADEPDHVEDVTDFVATKLEALEAHQSQFESTMKAVDDAELDEFRARVADRLGLLGAPHSMRAAEVFTLIDDL
ncbi:PIG-L deacetylase family protein [Ilumatobacter nonamiensis]|uniref:PIG-L deacetylase family protein n=1 Tax=Ilumatobacter nonamiensis TaxID=467093 RepID=UPI000346E0E7|nr:PIG-L deacetylase family protein [Ilumatobacter nonamiensis]